VTARLTGVGRGGARAPVLSPGVCDVWWARPDDVRPEHDALLAEADLERRARLHRAADRRRSAVAAVVVRLVLGAAVGTPPARLVIDRTCRECGGAHGKPRLPDVPDVHFSVSHSAGWVAVAVRIGGPVGIDIEEVAPWAAADLDDVAQLTLAPEERAVLVRQPLPRRALAYTTYWTRKEAAVKATGEGLAAPLDELVVSPPSAAARVLRWDGRRDIPSLHELHPPAGHVGALALLGDPPERVAERDAGPLLRRAVVSGRRAAYSSRRVPSVAMRSHR
jgi:4'-phosphopantetheinyl transferase